MRFSAHAQWIWNDGEASPRNFWSRLRRTFQCPTQLKRASLLITADNRYELYINGHDLGNGPVRSFPWSYSYDEYDVTSWLRGGEENVLAAHVVHWGDHTFQAIRARAGFLCELVLELSNGQVEYIVSDEHWSIAPEPAFTRNTPRISVQLPFEEQYDARLAEDGWTMAGYSIASSWQPARTIGPVGTAPWQELTPRTIPFLTRDSVMPTKVLALEIAQLPPGYRWSFDLRHYVKNPRTGLHAETIGTCGRAFATEILASSACSVTLISMNNHDYRGPQMACNGRPVTTELALHKGRNLFVISDTDWPAVYLQTTQELTFDATRIAHEAGVVWAYLGPFNERDNTYQRILSSSDVKHLPAIPREGIYAAQNLEDIFLQTRSQHYFLPANGFCTPSIARPQPRTALTRPYSPLAEHLTHFLHQNADYTLLYPQQEGDIHLIVDFGREVCGFPVLELDAQEGTIVDATFFEGIDDSGIFWTDGLRNSFRYVCRAGYQVFRSYQRRGFRYASLTFRFNSFNTPTNAPVKLYNVRCLLNTYPVEQRGNFACSDALLTNIWDIAAYTVRLCMEDTYVDCPAYEQVFWVGDARNSTLVNAVAFGANALTERCLRLTAQSLSHNLDSIKPPLLQHRAHLTTDHVASGWFSEIPMWSFLWIWNVWEHYLLTGDRVTLAELYPAVRECLERCLSFLSPRGLLNVPDVWNLVDWSAMDLTRDGEVTSSSALLAESLRRAALMAEELMTISSEMPSLGQEVVHYREAATRISAAINTYCWSEERSAYVDTVRDEQAYLYHQAIAAKYHIHLDEHTQFLARTRISEQTNTLILLCNCAPDERAERILPLVEAAQHGKFVGSAPSEVAQFPPDEIVPIGSPWFLFFTLETLLKYRKLDSAIPLIRTQWGRMLAQGATTFWETFPNLQATHWSRSLCHGWSAAPAYFLSTHVLGIQPAAPGYTRVRIAPHTSGLDWAQGTIPTPHGDIYVRWSRQEKALEIELHIPVTIVVELLVEEATGQPEHIQGVQGQVSQKEGRWQVIFPNGGFAYYRLELR